MPDKGEVFVLPDLDCEDQVIGRQRSPIVPPGARLDSQGGLHATIREEPPRALLDRRNLLRDLRDARAAIREHREPGVDELLELVHASGPARARGIDGTAECAGAALD